MTQGHNYYHQGHSFITGLGGGVVAGLLLAVTGLYLAGLLEQASAGSLALAWLTARLDQLLINLRSSVLPFTMVLLFYIYQLRSLRRELDSSLPALDQIVRREQLLDLSATLFFGIGVIWTAIGMRAALLYSLGEPDTVAADGAFALLQRMVDGGILLALSTTIVGGIGGYIMRLVKSLWLGPALNRLYINHGSQPLDEGLVLLRRIEVALNLDRNREAQSGDS